MLIKFIVIPVITVISAVTLITVFNISSIKEYQKSTVQEARKSFIEKNKKVINKKVKHIVKAIEYERKSFDLELKSNLKKKLSHINSGLTSFYNKYNTSHAKKDLNIQDELLSLIKHKNLIHTNDNYFVIDKITGKILYSGLKDWQEGENLKDTIDKNGVNVYDAILNSIKNKEAPFYNLNCTKEKEYLNDRKKLIAVSLFEPFNFIIGIVKKVATIDKSVQQKIAKRLQSTQENVKDYAFIIEIDNIYGGNNFGRVVVSNVPVIDGKLSDDKRDLRGKYHRKEYLRGIRNKGEVYVDYWYKKPNDLENIGKKLSYFYHYKPWNWIVGCGFYFDELDNEIKSINTSLEKKTDDNITNGITIGLLALFISISILILYTKNYFKKIKEYISKIEDQKNLFEKEKETFKSIYENSSDGVLLLKGGKIFDCNHSTLRIFDLNSKEQILSKTPIDLSPKYQLNNEKSMDLVEYYSKGCRQNSCSRFKWKFNKSNGDIIYTEVTLTNITNKDVDIIHAVIRENTDIK
ncbi:MAG: cache domain-containing protein [Campylobacterota bacterium]|nr:cache domain-containing protein [Campylobacterota bacterium]